MRECNLSAANLIGQTNLIRRLEDAIGKEQPEQHAFLFTGDPGMGKRSFAMQFAQNILCPNNNDLADNKIACFNCDSCRYFMAGTHPDFKILNKGTESVVKVERIRREIVSDLQIRPQLSANKVYLINMDDLNEQGQNALLKSLEEPPEYAIFLLTATLQDNLLETILSRVAIFSLQRYQDNEIRSILEKNQISEDLDFIVQYAAGNPGSALQIASDEIYRKIRISANDFFFRFPTASRTEMLTEGIEYFKKNKDQTDLILDIWQGLIRDLLILLEDNNSDQLKQADLTVRLQRLAEAYLDHKTVKQEIYKDRILHSFGAITEVRRASKVNASFDGMLGQLLLTLRKDLYIDDRGN